VPNRRANPSVCSVAAADAWVPGVGHPQPATLRPGGNGPGVPCRLGCDSHPAAATDSAGGKRSQAQLPQIRQHAWNWRQRRSAAAPPRPRV
jgi:hypothetical protein